MGPAVGPCAPSTHPIPSQMEKGELWDELDRVGKVMDINMPKNASTGKPYGYAFVEFGDGPRRGC